ncbi:MAG: FIST N-terminal domain-containing protein [Dehalococcoidia bacterium]|nr:FIST N-terminal domain-containing protein [Dehalococcoidia bacterium]
MNWASAVSEQADLTRAVEECAGDVRSRLGDLAPDLAVIFVSSHYERDSDDVARHVEENLATARIFGCSSGGVIGGGLEVEQRPAVSITAAVLPGVEIVGFYLDQENLPDPDSGPGAWEELAKVSPGQDPQFIMLADPLSFQVQDLLMGLDFAFTRSAKIGGLASSGDQQGRNALFLDGQVSRSGAVGLALHGNISVDTVVAQGCRPIGRPMRVTQSRRNLLTGLEGQPPLTVMKELFGGINRRDQELMRHSLFLGVVMDELIEAPKQGDFLIRNVVGIDARTGILAIGELLKEGQLVQFHLRDAETSAEDLTAVLERYAMDKRENQVQGALLFSCLGRGQHLYGRPNHDSDIFRQKLGPVPLGGFFCNGEIGPVSGTTFLHGYTSAFAMFRPKF